MVKPPNKPNPTKPAMEAELCDKISNYLDSNVDSQAAKNWKDGIGGSQLPEALPTFIELPCEDVWKGQNNSYIVLGRDRPGAPTTGYNAHTQAGAIDIVVGRMGSGVVACAAPKSESGASKTKSKTAKNASKDYPSIGQKTVFVHPMFKDDAARIYISQKSDVDENFSLVPGNIGFVGQKTQKMDWGPAACIAMKADDVRLIARRGIKLVTMGPGSETTSQSEQPIRSVAGINIIAGNKTDDKYFSLQPMIKGDNLVECLNEIVAKINSLSGIVGSFLTFQHAFNKEIAAHTHVGMDGKTILPANHVLEMFAGPRCSSALSVNVQEGLENFKKNIGALKLNTLSPTNEKYICSRWNYVN
tara:strand:+ start:480 stop:1556 length:1077 start_codon:yes stop_codon:yes gene_type:complete